MAQNIYDSQDFFDQYKELPRSIQGLEGAIEWPIMRRLVGDVREAMVLDLGCGYGWFCRWAVEDGGARAVHGIDISEKMLERARSWPSKSNETSSRVSYEQKDLENVLLPQGRYDFVYSSLMLHYLPRSATKSLFAQVYLSLKPGGRFVFSVEHPVVTAPSDPDWKKTADDEFYWPLNQYIDEGLRITSWLGSDEVRKYHITTETYVNLLLEAGFALDSFKEHWEELAIGTKKDRTQGHRPYFLMIGARRA